MKKPKDESNIPIVVKNESLKEFFSRGREIAKKLDKKTSFSPIRIISFEDVHDLTHFLTDSKLNLVSIARKNSLSISSLAKVLHRSRSSINKDVDLLESVGILKSEYVTNPGHGKCRVITAFDDNPIKLTVETIL